MCKDRSLTTGGDDGCESTGAEKVLLHNFAGRVSVARLAAEHGFFMSFPPVVVNKPERSKLIKYLPLANLCLETDSPALGKEKGTRNEPVYISEACQYIAKLKAVDCSVISCSALQNTCDLFNLPKHEYVYSCALASGATT